MRPQVPTDIIERNIKRASESKADYAEASQRGRGEWQAPRGGSAGAWHRGGGTPASGRGAAAGRRAALALPLP